MIQRYMFKTTVASFLLISPLTLTTGNVRAEEHDSKGLQSEKYLHPTIRDMACKITTYGYFDEKEYIQERDSNSRDPNLKGKYIKYETDIVPISVGRVFGFEFLLNILPQRGRISGVLKHPPIEYPKGVIHTEVHQSYKYEMMGSIASYLITGTDRFPPGEYEFHISYGGKELCSKAFTLL